MMLVLSAMSLYLLAAPASATTSGGRITGDVTDATSGTPISDARVTLTMVVDVPGGTFGRRPRQSVTDANGAFAFDGLEPAEYILNVEKTGFATYPDVLGDERPERLAVAAAGPEVQPLHIALKKGAVIAGRILSASGEPLADLHVSTLRRTDKIGPLGFVQNGDAQTNDLGEFRIAGLSAGDYVVVASVQRRGPFAAIQTGTATTFAPTYFPGTLDQNAARVMTLVPGQTVLSVEFTIATVAAFRVSGVAVDQDGHPSPHAIVTLISNMGTIGFFMPMMSIAADVGTFTVGEVSPGTYHVVARANASGARAGFGATSIDVATAADGSVSRPTTITVGSADVTGLTVVVDRK